MRKKLYAAVMAAGITLSIFSGYALEVAEWAREDVEIMISCGVVPESIRNQSYFSEITREQFVELLYNAYQVKREERYTPEQKKPFPDTDSMSAASLYELGVLSGDENGNFAGIRYVTRQEAAKIFCGFYRIINDRNMSVSDLDVLQDYKDEKEISEWARKYVAAMAEGKMMEDLGDGKFHPLDSMTIQQAIVIAGRMTGLKTVELPSFEGTSPVPSITLSEDESDFLVSASWKTDLDTKEYTVTVTEWRDTVHGEEIGAKDPVVYTVSEPQISFAGEPNRRYVIEISGNGFQQTIERYTPIAIPYQTRLDELEQFGGLPETQEEAELLMQNITVNVWKMQNGKKVPATIQMAVHKAIADKLQQVFQEIFEGEEQFPIYSAGAYSWRGGRSEHNWGTAVDINPDENYCVYTNGTVVGKYWKPYLDPYSITPYGEVIRAFEKHGFTWGGDAWSGNRDFMHFSYLGT